MRGNKIMKETENKQLDPITSMMVSRLRGGERSYHIIVSPHTTKTDLDHCLKLLKEYDKKLHKEFIIKNNLG